MRSARDQRAHLVASRQLYGGERGIHKQIGGVCEAIQRLHHLSKNWPAFAPRLSTLDESIAQVDAVARALRELRGTMCLPGGPADAG